MFGTEYIKRGQIWRHERNGKNYYVTGIVNKGNSVGDDNNPPIVLYQDGEGRRFGRLLIKWEESFTLVGKL